MSDELIRVPAGEVADHLTSYLGHFAPRLIVATPTLDDGWTMLREVALRAGARGTFQTHRRVEFRGPTISLVAVDHPGSAAGLHAADLVVVTDDVTNPTFLADVEGTLAAAPRFHGVARASDLLKRNGTDAFARSEGSE